MQFLKVRHQRNAVIALTDIYAIIIAVFIRFLLIVVKITGDRKKGYISIHFYLTIHKIKSLCAQAGKEF